MNKILVELKDSAIHYGDKSIAINPSTKTIELGFVIDLETGEVLDTKLIKPLTDIVVAFKKEDKTSVTENPPMPDQPEAMETDTPAKPTKPKS